MMRLNFFRKKQEKWIIPEEVIRLHKKLSAHIGEGIRNHISSKYIDRFGLESNPHSELEIALIWSRFIFKQIFKKFVIVRVYNIGRLDNNFDNFLFELELFHIQKNLLHSKQFNYPLKGLHTQHHEGLGSRYKDHEGTFKTYHRYGADLSEIYYCDIISTFRQCVEEHNVWLSLITERVGTTGRGRNPSVWRHFSNQDQDCEQGIAKAPQMYAPALIDRLFAAVPSNHDVLTYWREQRWQGLDEEVKRDEWGAMFKDSICPWWDAMEKERDSQSILQIYRGAFGLAEEGASRLYY